VVVAPTCMRVHMCICMCVYTDHKINAPRPKSAVNYIGQPKINPRVWSKGGVDIGHNIRQVRV
jgi:hypothetical protein